MLEIIRYQFFHKIKTINIPLKVNPPNTEK